MFLRNRPSRVTATERTRLNVRSGLDRGELPYLPGALYVNELGRLAMNRDALLKAGVERQITGANDARDTLLVPVSNSRFQRASSGPLPAEFATTLDKLYEQAVPEGKRAQINEGLLDALETIIFDSLAVSSLAEKDPKTGVTRYAVGVYVPEAAPKPHHVDIGDVRKASPSDIPRHWLGLREMDVNDRGTLWIDADHNEVASGQVSEFLGREWRHGELLSASVQLGNDGRTGSVEFSGAEQFSVSHEEGLRIALSALAMSLMPRPEGTQA